MSRIGKKSIIIPTGVEATVEKDLIKIKGPKGALSLRLPKDVSVALTKTDNGQELNFSVKDETEKKERSSWGTAQSLTENMIEGVTKGYSRSLELEGVGFRVKQTGKQLVFELGFSHDINFTLPEGIEAKVEKNTVTVSGIDCQLVGETAAQIRSLRKPEPYKGKGIHYVGEVIRRKVGKAATKTAE